MYEFTREALLVCLLISLIAGPFGERTHPTEQNKSRTIKASDALSVPNG